MRQVFLVSANPADEHWIEAAFSTREKAQEFIDAQNDLAKDYRIEIFALDVESQR